MFVMDESKEHKKISFRRSVSNRILLCTAVALPAIVIVLIITCYFSTRNTLNAYFKEQLEIKESIVEFEMQQDQAQLISLASSLAENFSSNWERFIENNEIGFLLSDVIESNGAESIAIYGNDISTIGFDGMKEFSPPIDAINAVLNGEKFVDYIKIAGNVVSVCGVPIRSNNSIVASLFTMRRITSENFCEKIKTVTDCEFTMFDKYTRLETTLKGMAGTKISDTTLIDTVTNTGKRQETEAVLGDETCICLYFPILNASGKTIEVFFLGYDITIRAAMIKKLIFSMLPTALILITLMEVFLILIVLNPMLRLPLLKLNNAVQNLASGDADLSMRLEHKGKTEFAQIAGNINVFIASLQEIVKQIRETALKVQGESEQIRMASQSVSVVRQQRDETTVFHV